MAEKKQAAVAPATLSVEPAVSTAAQGAMRFEVMAAGEDWGDIVSREMDGLGSISLDQIKMPVGGAIAFEVPGEDEDRPEMTKELVGVILDHHPVNVYWAEPYGQAGDEAATPDCYSIDGKMGFDRRAGEARQCQTCPFNAFGSAGRGKACKNSHRLYILPMGAAAPMVLTIPPTGLKALRDYIGKRILLGTPRGYKETHKVVTKITLKKDVNADKKAFSRPVFALDSLLSPEEIQGLEGMRAFCQAIRQQVPIMDAREGAPDTPQAGDPAFYANTAEMEFMEIPAGEEDSLPFN